MRLAYLDPHAVPDDAPEALQILYTVDALGQNGVNVHLITPPAERGARSILGRELSDRARTHPVSAGFRIPGIRSNQPFYRAAVRALRALDVDAVLVRNLKMAEHLLHQLPGLPLFFETHELFAQTYREEHVRPSWRERRKLGALVAREGFVYQKAKGLIALTSLLLDDIRGEYGIGTPAIVAPDGVDLEQAQNRPPPAPNPAPVLLYLGSLHPWKGVDTLIRAMTMVTKDAILHVAGGATERIRELTDLARELGVESRITFLGAIDPARRFAVIAGADICLLPLTETSIASRYTSPLKLFEYLAAGKPIVVSDLPSMRSVIEPGQQALAVKAGDPKAMADAVNRLLADAALRTRLGEAARLLARRYEWSARAATIRQFIEAETGRGRL